RQQQRLVEIAHPEALAHVSSLTEKGHSAKHFLPEMVYSPQAIFSLRQTPSGNRTRRPPVQSSPGQVFANTCMRFIAGARKAPRTRDVVNRLSLPVAGQKRPGLLLRSDVRFNPEMTTTDVDLNGQR